MVSKEEAKELVKKFKKGKIKEDEFVEMITTNSRQKYVDGYTRYEMVLYKDVRVDGRWNTTRVTIVPKTDNIEDVEKFVPNAEKAIKEEEKAIQEAEKIVGEDLPEDVEDREP